MLYGMFFAMAFALVRGYHDQPLAAGLRLTIIPIALGIVAPFSGALYETASAARDGRRDDGLPGGGARLATVLTGAPASLPDVMIALAAFGGGLGLFIAPNNSAVISAAPADKSGEAGGLLNLMRMFGTGIGVAAASSVLSWRLELTTGVGERTVGATEQALLAAVGDVLLMLAAFAVIAGTASQLRSGPPRPRRAFVTVDQETRNAAG